MQPLLRALRVLRPLEWALLGLFAFLLLRGGLRVFEVLPELASLRTRRIFIALAMVGTVHLIRRYRGLPARELGPARTRALQLGLVFALLPLVLAGFVRLFDMGLWNEAAATSRAEAIPLVSTVVLQVFTFGLPTILLWLAVAIHLRQYGRLEARRLFGESAVGVGATVREWAPLLLLISGYAWIGAVIGYPDHDFDGAMAAADRVLFFGADPVEKLQAIINGPLNEWLAFSYSFYGVLYPLCLGAVFMVGGRLALRETATAVGLALAISLASYMLIPVKGPVLSRTFSVPLDFWLVGPIKEAMMDKARITYDCFPSFHTAGAMLLSWGCWRHARKVFWWTIAPSASIPFACVYLRYHYVVDVIAGLAMSALLVWAVPRLLRRWSHENEIPPPSGEGARSAGEGAR